MERQRGYKAELRITNKQRTALLSHAGAARFAFNWALARCKDRQSKPNAIQLHREWNEWKQESAPWVYGVSKCAPQEAFRDLQTAFKNFFKRHKDGVGYPKFRSKKRGIGGFRLTGTIKVESRRIQLPRLGWLKLKEHDYLPIDAHILSATVSERAGRWFVSLQIQEDVPAPPAATGAVLGIDLGVKTLATCSDGTVYHNPKALKQKERQLAHLQRRFSRQQKGSKRREKTKRRIARLHWRIACTRLDNIHKATTEIAKTKRPSVVVLEDLSVKDMLQDGVLAKLVSDAGMREFRRQMEYKTVWNGSTLMLADRYYPSSKRCSGCGRVKDTLALDERTYHCDGCGLVEDRDVNASKNLEQWALAVS